MSTVPTLKKNKRVKDKSQGCQKLKSKNNRKPK